MVYIFLICSSAFLIPLFSKDLLLDEMMSREDQKKTGVSYLTPKQKIALENWINQNCNCTTQTPSPNEEKKYLFLSINIDNGQKIQLNDNSVWEVAPKDHPISAAWLTPIPIAIVPNDDPDYPYQLINKNTGISIQVKPSEITPTPPSEELPPSHPLPLQ